MTMIYRSHRGVESLHNGTFLCEALVLDGELLEKCCKSAKLLQDPVIQILSISIQILRSWTKLLAHECVRVGALPLFCVRSAVCPLTCLNPAS